MLNVPSSMIEVSGWSRVSDGGGDNVMAPGKTFDDARIDRIDQREAVLYAGDGQGQSLGGVGLVVRTDMVSDLCETSR